MNEEAKTYATTEADTFRNSLQYLIEQQNQQQLLTEQAASQRYQNLLNQINQQKQPIQQQYQIDAQQAYINKMLAQKQTESNLSRLGLNTQGFAIGQLAQNENAYASNLNALKINKNQMLQNIANQGVNATGEYNANMLDLGADNQRKLLELLQTIEAQVNNKYNNTYAAAVANQEYNDAMKQQAYERAFKEQQYADQLKQQEYENTIAQQKYADQLKQQAWENAYNNRQLAASQTSFIDKNDAPQSKATINPVVAASMAKQKEEQAKSMNELRIVDGMKYTPILSSKKATSWYNTNISDWVNKYGFITEQILENRLTAAIKNKEINATDASKILEQFGQ